VSLSVPTRRPAATPACLPARLPGTAKWPALALCMAVVGAGRTVLGDCTTCTYVQPPTNYCMVIWLTNQRKNNIFVPVLSLTFERVAFLRRLNEKRKKKRRLVTRKLQNCTIKRFKNRAHMFFYRHRVLLVHKHIVQRKPDAGFSSSCW